MHYSKDAHKHETVFEKLDKHYKVYFSLQIWQKSGQTQTFSILIIFLKCRRIAKNTHKSGEHIFGPCAVTVCIGSTGPDQ